MIFDRKIIASADSAKFVSDLSIEMSKGWRAVRVWSETISTPPIKNGCEVSCIAITVLYAELIFELTATWIIQVPSTKQKILIKGEAMSVVLPSNFYVLLQEVQWHDVNGNLAKVQEGSLQYSTSDANIAFIAPDPEGSELPALVGKVVGTCQIVARADADLGDGVKEVAAVDSVETVAGEAAGGSFVFGPVKPFPSA